jgi:D-alanine-D-alanine ligase
MLESVLVIYNAVDTNAKDAAAWHESNAGVLDEVNAVTAALERLGIDYRRQPVENLEHLNHILQQSRQRIIFNLVEEFSDNIFSACFVPAVCRANGRAFTGNDTPALLLSQNKWQAKAVLKAASLPCPNGVLIPITKQIFVPALSSGKYIVKPLYSDASEGIDSSSIVEIPGSALRKAVERVHRQFGQPALVEQYIPGRELNVSVLQREGRLEVIAIAEIDFSKFDDDQPRIVDYSAKWQPESFAYNNTPRIIPAQISAQTAEIVEKSSLQACSLTGCSGYIRVDFRMDKDEQPYILEINPNPDISPDAGFAAALAFRGIKYEKFVEILLESAINKEKAYSRKGD